MNQSSQTPAKQVTKTTNKKEPQAQRPRKDQPLLILKHVKPDPILPEHGWFGQIKPR